MVAPSHLRSLQALELAIRTGSLKGAADALWITPAAVGQRLKSLEDYLGVELLSRGRSGLSPTPALAGALDHLRTAFRELDTVTGLLELQRGHEIHIAASSDFVELWLKPRLSGFEARHPHIRFCINGEGGPPLRIGQLACEISFGPPREAANTDVLFRDFVVPICSPENALRLSALTRRERLEGFPLLHLDFYKNDPAPPGWAQWIGRHRLKRTEPNRGIRFQRISRALEAVLADAGLTICGIALIGHFIDDGRVTFPFPESTGSWTTHAFQARFRNEALVRPQVRRFRQWLNDESAATRAWMAQRTRSKRHRRGDSGIR
ncbi:MAG: LysR substrate-binding domain-containing protein [Steroidobacteraceae bacterium]